MSNFSAYSLSAALVAATFFVGTPTVVRAQVVQAGGTHRTFPPVSETPPFNRERTILPVQRRSTVPAAQTGANSAAYPNLSAALRALIAAYDMMSETTGNRNRPLSQLQIASTELTKTAATLSSNNNRNDALRATNRAILLLRQNPPNPAALQFTQRAIEDLEGLIGVPAGFGGGVPASGLREGQPSTILPVSREHTLPNRAELPADWNTVPEAAPIDGRPNRRPALTKALQDLIAAYGDLTQNPARGGLALQALRDAQANLQKSGDAPEYNGRRTDAISCVNRVVEQNPRNIEAALSLIAEAIRDLQNCLITPVNSRSALPTSGIPSTGGATILPVVRNTSPETRLRGDNSTERFVLPENWDRVPAPGMVHGRANKRPVLVAALRALIDACGAMNESPVDSERIIHQLNLAKTDLEAKGNRGAADAAAWAKRDEAGSFATRALNDFQQNSSNSDAQEMTLKAIESTRTCLEMPI